MVELNDVKVRERKILLVLYFMLATFCTVELDTYRLYAISPSQLNTSHLWPLSSFMLELRSLVRVPAVM